MPDGIKLTQKEAAQGLTRRVVAIATECAEEGMPPAAISVAIMSAAIGLSYKDDGLAATVRWLHDMGDSLEHTTDPSFNMHPEGAA